MAEFLLLMHGDVTQDEQIRDWPTYLEFLSAEGALRGGSAIGPGECVRRSGAVPDVTRQIVGYVKVEARDFDHARQLVQTNPIYEAGGTVEIRELHETD